MEQETGICWVKPFHISVLLWKEFKLHGGWNVLKVRCCCLTYAVPCSCSTPPSMLFWKEDGRMGKEEERERKFTGIKGNMFSDFLQPCLFSSHWYICSCNDLFSVFYVMTCNLWILQKTVSWSGSTVAFIRGLQNTAFPKVTWLENPFLFWTPIYNLPELHSTEHRLK